MCNFEPIVSQFSTNTACYSAFHVHVRTIGDNDEILFRDDPRSHPDTARAYEVLKQSLLPEYKHNRDGYTEVKSVFVKQVVEAAKHP